MKIKQGEKNVSQLARVSELGKRALTSLNRLPAATERSPWHLWIPQASLPAQVLTTRVKRNFPSTEFLKLLTVFQCCLLFNKDHKLSVCFAGDTGPQGMLYTRSGFHTLWMQAVMQMREVWDSDYRIREILWIALPYHLLVVDTVLKCYRKLSKKDSPKLWTSTRNA